MLFIYINYINNLGQNVNDTQLHFYADETIIYCFAKTVNDALYKLQSAFMQCHF